MAGYEHSFLRDGQCAGPGAPLTALLPGFPSAQHIAYIDGEVRQEGNSGPREANSPVIASSGNTTNFAPMPWAWRRSSTIRRVATARESDRFNGPSCAEAIFSFLIRWRASDLGLIRCNGAVMATVGWEGLAFF